MAKHTRDHSTSPADKIQNVCKRRKEEKKLYAFIRLCCAWASHKIYICTDSHAAMWLGCVEVDMHLSMFRIRFSRTWNGRARAQHSLKKSRRIEEWRKWDARIKIQYNLQCDYVSRLSNQGLIRFGANQRWTQTTLNNMRTFYSPSLSIVSFAHEKMTHELIIRSTIAGRDFSTLLKATFGRGNHFHGAIFVMHWFCADSLWSIRLFLLRRQLKAETQTQWQLGAICRMQRLCATNDATKNIDWKPFTVDAKTKTSGRKKNMNSVLRIEVHAHFYYNWMLSGDANHQYAEMMMDASEWHKVELCPNGRPRVDRVWMWLRLCPRTSFAVCFNFVFCYDVPSAVSPSIFRCWCSRDNVSRYWYGLCHKLWRCVDATASLLQLDERVRSVLESSSQRWNGCRTHSGV